MSTSVLNADERLLRYKSTVRSRRSTWARWLEREQAVWATRIEEKEAVLVTALQDKNYKLVEIYDLSLQFCRQAHAALAHRVTSLVCPPSRDAQQSTAAATAQEPVDARADEQRSASDKLTPTTLMELWKQEQALWAQRVEEKEAALVKVNEEEKGTWQHGPLCDVHTISLKACQRARHAFDTRIAFMNSTSATPAVSSSSGGTAAGSGLHVESGRPTMSAENPQTLHARKRRMVDDSATAAVAGSDAVCGFAAKVAN